VEDRPETRYVKTSDGLHIGYQVFGSGTYDLVFNQAWVSNVDAMWDVPAVAQILGAMSSRSRVIVFDRRGVGISDRPTSPGSMSLEVAADDMREVMDAAASTRAAVFGFEAGATVSLFFAASMPERTLGLLLLAPYVYGRKTAEFPWGRTEAEQAEWEERIDSSWGTEAFWMYNASNMPELADDPDEVKAWARLLRLSASPQAALAIEHVELQVDARALLPRIQVPTLVMQTTADLERGNGYGPWVAQQIPGARFLSLRYGGHLFDPKDRSVFDEMDRFVRGIREVEAGFDRVLATVLFTDIVGSTEKASELGDRRWRDLLERHHAAVRAMLGRYRGTEIDTAGDGFLATFDGPARGVRCAQAIAEAVKPLGLEVRSGLHTGEIETVDGKVGGMAVHIGARVGAVAGASQIMVSRTVKDLTAGSGLFFEDAGEHELKGVPDRWHLYRVVSEREQALGASDESPTRPRTPSTI
jgi:class 3 adenylate cyclase